MRNPANSLRAELRRSTEAAREAAAGKLYGLDELRKVLTDRAAAGFDFALVEAPDGMNLRDTKAAIAALAWLADMKLETGWEVRAGGTDANGSNSHSLRISWKPQALPS